VLKSRAASSNHNVEYIDFSLIEYARGKGETSPIVIMSPATQKSSRISDQTISEEIENLTKQLDRLKEKQRVEQLKKDSVRSASDVVEDNTEKRPRSERTDESWKSAAPMAPGNIGPGSILEQIIPRATSDL
jgi:hypothetical protein